MATAVDFLFTIAYLGSLATFGYQTWRLIQAGQAYQDENTTGLTNIKTEFLLFSTYTLAWFICFTAVLTHPENLFFVQLQKIQSGLWALSLIYVLAAGFFDLQQKTQSVRERYTPSRSDDPL